MDDVALSTAAFVRVGRTVAGFISSPLGTYQLLTDDSGVSVVQEIADDPRSGPTPDDSVEAPGGPAPDTRLGTRSAFRPMATAFESTVDVLVVYTPGALAAAGNLERLTADLELGAALADSALRNAGTGGLRVVHVAPVQSEESADTAQALLRLWTRTDGFLDDVHALRERYAADLITLVTSNVETGICGRAYNTVRAGGDTGLNVVEQECLSGVTLAHEVGHNLGLAHDWIMTSQGGYRPSSKGFVDTSGLFYTVMAYPDHCRKAGLRCARIAAFSNPLNFHRGQPAGVSIGTGMSCVAGEINNPPCDADAVSTLAATFPIVADYRVGDLLGSGQALAPGQSIRTTTGCSLMYQSDGKLVSIEAPSRSGTLALEAQRLDARRCRPMAIWWSTTEPACQDSTPRRAGTPVPSCVCRAIAPLWSGTLRTLPPSGGRAGSRVCGKSALPCQPAGRVVDGLHAESGDDPSRSDRPASRSARRPRRTRP